jgi:pre-mRNA-splicing factor 18
MDFLKAEIAAKRKPTDAPDSRPQKYMRKGDIERLKREQLAQEEAAKRQVAKEEEDKKEKEVSAQCTICYTDSHLS